MHEPLWMWIGFFAIVITLLALDLGVFHRKAHSIRVKESLMLSGFYVSMGLLFGVWIYFQLGTVAAQEYLTGFLIEKTLSLDNIFVIMLIFGYFGIPRLYQHKVLFWGIFGVIILRACLIAVGAILVSKVSWILYLFGVFLIIIGVKMFFIQNEFMEIKNNRFISAIKRKLNVSDKLDGHKFWTKINRVTVFTPLFSALIMIEFTDLIFALDSVPAIFAITKDPYIVYTSNIFAVLGLRALYFALDEIIYRFYYLKYALACILIFIGGKIFVADWLGIEKIPTLVSLGTTVTLIFLGIAYSLYKTKPQN